jgi:putative hemolysin
MLSSSIILFWPLLVALGIGAGFLTAPTLGQAQSNPSGAAGLANPASNNCVNKGGKVMLEKNGSGGQ